MTAAYFEDHPTDPDRVILRKPKYEDYKKPWVGLTDDEYQQILIQHDGAGLIAFFNLVEERLRSKNT